MEFSQVGGFFFGEPRDFLPGLEGLHTDFQIVAAFESDQVGDLLDLVELGEGPEVSLVGLEKIVDPGESSAEDLGPLDFQADEMFSVGLPGDRPVQFLEGEVLLLLVDENLGEEKLGLHLGGQIDRFCADDLPDVLEGFLAFPHLVEMAGQIQTAFARVAVLLFPHETEEFLLDDRLLLLGKEGGGGRHPATRSGFAGHPGKYQKKGNGCGRAENSCRMPWSESPESLPNVRHSGIDDIKNPSRRELLFPGIFSGDTCPRGHVSPPDQFFQPRSWNASSIRSTVVPTEVESRAAALLM